MLLRYPGGKSRAGLNHIIINKLTQYLENNEYDEFREPFFGAGNIGLSLLKRAAPKVWLNDLDFGIGSLFHAVFNESTRLESLIRDFVPTVAAFFQFKDELLNGNGKEDPVLFGFKKLAIHQISYSGLGTRSGGPLGGASQASRYRISCRWSPNYLVKEIRRIKGLVAPITLREGTCTCCDFQELIQSPGRALLYLDPPYYEKGPSLYQYGFAGQHERLAESLRSCQHDWVLSYDDCPAVRRLYEWARCQTVTTKYSAARSVEKQELIITRP